jgi:hypothetical protein
MFPISTRKVYLNGLIFQVPNSIFSSQRFTVHPDGTGTSWDEDSPDIDQPHGLDYRALQDLRKGIRKRIEHEHSDFADASVGGIHIPGGCAVLGIEDGTATIIADGTLKGHGIVWDNTSRLWCSTAAAGASTTGDFIPVKLHPDKQWGGGDITWTGAHEFDASVDISGNLAIDGDVTIDGAFKVDGTSNFTDECDFSSVNITGTVTTFGTWASKNTGTSYQAETDGIVIAIIGVGELGVGLTDSNNPPTTERCRVYGADGYRSTLPMPVKKGDYWKVTGTFASIYWLPFGS